MYKRQGLGDTITYDGFGGLLFFYSGILLNINDNIFNIFVSLEKDTFNSISYSIATVESECYFDK